MKNIFNHLRNMSGGKLTQSQVNASNAIIAANGVDVLTDALGMDADGGYKLTSQALRNIYSNADMDFVDIINKHASTFGITTKKRMAMFIAHAIHESNGFNSLQESFNYRPSRLKAVFGFRIPSLNFATNILAKGKEEVANHLYGGRYGNKGPNDGWLYSGKGIGGLTFKGNYIVMQRVMSKHGLHYDIVNNPLLLLNKEVATLSYMAYWLDKDLNSYADAGKIIGATKVINGGRNGLADRKKYYKLALNYL